MRRSPRHHLALATTAYPGRVTVFTIWPDDVVWRRVSPRLYWLHVLSRMILVLFLATCAALTWLLFEYWPVVVGIGVVIALIVLRLLFLPGACARGDTRSAPTICWSGTDCCTDACQSSPMDGCSSSMSPPAPWSGCSS